MADGSAAEDDDDGSDVAGGGASVAVLLVASVAGVFDDDAISFVFVRLVLLLTVSLLRMFEFDWQTVGVLSYICRYNCQSIKA